LEVVVLARDTLTDFVECKIGGRRASSIIAANLASSLAKHWASFFTTTLRHFVKKAVATEIVSTRTTVRKNENLFEADE
jgi:hypothetical protein